MGPKDHNAEGGGGDRAPAAGPEADVSGSFDFRRRSDARLLARAVREGWPVPPHRRPELVAAASEAARDPATPATPARAVVAVARAFLAMSEANLKIRRRRWIVGMLVQSPRGSPRSWG